MRSFDEPTFEGRSPAIFVADPWAPESAAVVEWSDERGGIPFKREPMPYYLISVREALQFFGPDYDARIENGEVEALRAKLSYHTTQKNAERISRVRPGI